MTVITSIDVSRARAQSKLSTYRKLLIFVIGVEVFAALIALLNSSYMTNVLGLDASAARAVCAWAGTFLFANALAGPAVLGPIERRWTNVVMIIGRAFLAFVFLCQGFLWLGAFEAAAAAFLFVTFQSAIMEELQTRP